VNMSCRFLAAVLLAAGLVGCASEQLPADAPATTAVSSLTVPGGTEFHVTLAAAIGSTNMVGDSVSGTLASAIVVGDKVAVPAGSTIRGHVAGIDRARNGLELSFTKVTTPLGDDISLSSRLTAGVGISAVIPAGTDLEIILDQPLTITQRS
jgi:hypothetical protein